MCVCVSSHLYKLTILPNISYIYIPLRIDVSIQNIGRIKKNENICLARLLWEELGELLFLVLLSPIEGELQFLLIAPPEKFCSAYYGTSPRLARDQPSPWLNKLEGATGRVEAGVQIK